MNIKKIISVILFIAIAAISAIVFKQYADVDSRYMLILINVLALTLMIINLSSKEKIKEKVKEKIVEKIIYKEKENNEQNIENHKKDIVEPFDNNLNYKEYIEKQIRKLAKEYDIDKAVFYLKNKNDKKYSAITTYAYLSDRKIEDVEEGNGLVGQAIKEKQTVTLKNIPDGYITIFSGLGKSNPRSLVIIPSVINEEVISVVEISFLSNINDNIKKELEYSINQITQNIFDVI